MRTGLFLLPLLALTSCISFQTGESSLRDNLANRGPVSLSRSNPYIASNILLSNEVESNTTLKGFLKVRGNPDAIEVKKVLLRPYMMYFFYVAAQEVYILEESNHEWIIRGPQSIPEPVLEVLERTVPKGQESPNGSEGVELGASTVDAERSSEIPDEGAELIKPAAAKSDSLPAASSGGEEGDIIHNVKFKGETLRLIAEWYTGNRDSAARIARINGLKDMNALAMGQTIRVPRYLSEEQPTSDSGEG